MATAINRIPVSRNRHVPRQKVRDSQRARMWILLAVWALMMFGCAFFLIIRLARYDMVKKELERPLIIQSALPVASYRNPPPQRQQVESRASQNSFSTGDTVRGSITLAE